LDLDPWTWSFGLATATALVAGVVRGFSGFGAAMILVPVLAILYGPRVAVPVLLLVDILLTVPMVVTAVRRCAWGEVLPLVAGFAVTFPLGVYLLLVADPRHLTQAMAVVVLAVAAAMALGLRRTTQPSRPATVATGSAAGLLAGSTGIGGPPVILFWLSGQDAAARTRANIVVFFGFTGIIALAGFGTAGVLTADVLLLTAFLMPTYALGLWLGARAFDHTGDALYRRLALAIITAVGLSTLALA
jgi:uncharacterized membrane protein YfcA